MGLRGYSAAAGAAVLFGVQYVPVKKHETHDGSTFQFFLCSGVLLGTFWCAMLRSLLVYGTVSGVPLLLPGFVGGLFWATSNALVIPLVKIMGLGVGFSMYHVVNLMTGYGVGRFGLPLVSLPPDEALRPWLQDLGVVVLLVSLLLLLAVEVAGPLEEERGPSGGPAAGTGGGRPTGPGAGGGGAEGGRDARALLEPCPRSSSALRQPLASPSAEPQLDPPAQSTPVTSSVGSVVRRLALSVPLAIAAGVTTGLNAVPFSAWSKEQLRKGLEHDCFAYALSQALGIWVTSVTIYLGFATFMKLTLRASPAHSVIRPALAAGICWALGNVLMLVAIQSLGFAAAYALDAVGPIMVASIIAAALGEIRRGRQATLFIIAVALQSTGVVMIALGNGR